MNMINKVVNLSKAVIGHAANNFQLVSGDLLNNRRSICNSCNEFDAKNITCNKCGCFINIKTQWASEKCPLDKWGVEEPNAAINIDPILHRPVDTPYAYSEDANSMLPPNDCGCGQNNV